METKTMIGCKLAAKMVLTSVVLIALCGCEKKEQETRFLASTEKYVIAYSLG